MRIVLVLVALLFSSSCASANASRSPARIPATSAGNQQRNYGVRAWGGLGAGVGAAVGAGGSFEVVVADPIAVGVVGGAFSSSSFTLGPSSSGFLAFGGVNARWGPLRTLSEPGSHWSLSLGTGVGMAHHSWEEGECDFAIFDSGVDPNACQWVGESSVGPYVGGSAGWLYSFGLFGLGIDARMDTVLGSVSGAAITITAGPRLAF